MEWVFWIFHLSEYVLCGHVATMITQYYSLNYCWSFEVTELLQGSDLLKRISLSFHTANRDSLPSTLAINH